MQIVKGKQAKAKRVVIYGIEGIGKSLLASKFPAPLFIDIEGSTDSMDVERTPKPTSWTMLKQIMADVRTNHMDYKTLVIDTGDWAEKLGVSEFLAKHNITALGGQDDYGHSYNGWAQEWGKFLDSLSEFVDSGMNVVVLCHSQIRKTQVPEEFGAFDHWELKLEKKTSALLREWCQILLFANYKTLVIEDTKTHTKKGTGNKRVLFTEHSACYDAKSRDGFDLPDEIPMGKRDDPLPPSLAALFSTDGVKAPPTPAPKAEPTTTPTSQAHSKVRDLMKMHGVTYPDLLGVIVSKGHYPAGTKFETLSPQFLEGFVIPHWTKILTALGKGTA